MNSLSIALGVCNALILLALLYLAKIDLETHTVKNKWVITIMSFGIVPLILDCVNSSMTGGKWYVPLISRIGGCLACFGLMLLACSASRGGFGGGDIKLMAALGFVFGFWGGLFVSVLSASLYLGMAIFSKKLAKKKGLPAPKVLPYVPYIFLAAAPTVIVLSIPSEILSGWFTF